MQKKPNVILKDYLIEQVAKGMELPESVVHAVISFQGTDAAKAAHKYNEIEFSGFGKFLLSQPRLKRKILNISNILEGEVPEEKRKKLSSYLEELKSRERE